MQYVISLLSKLHLYKKSQYLLRVFQWLTISNVKPIGPLQTYADTNPNQWGEPSVTRVFHKRLMLTISWTRFDSPICKWSKKLNYLQVIDGGANAKKIIFIDEILFGLNPLLDGRIQLYRDSSRWFETSINITKITFDIKNNLYFNFILSMVFFIPLDCLFFILFFFFFVKK